MPYHHRQLENKLQEYLKNFSVVGLTGPRQSGKSTLLLHLLKDYQYVSFDDYQLLNFFHHDPEKFMRLYSDKVIFDEAQKAPELFNYIKIAVDKNRQTYGKFVLTGSTQFTLMQNITESLAGRIGLLSLLPYEITEIPKLLRKESIYQGGYPELINKKYQLAQDWFSSYLETYIEKDVSALAQIGDKRDFRRLISLLAANTAQQLNFNRYAVDLGVDIKTVKRWISILEASYIIFLLPPYHRNFGKRIVKSPKIYFYDTGLVSYLTGIYSTTLFEQGPMTGSIFENYIVSEVLKRELHRKTHAELFYIRTSHGIEVDLIIDRKTHKELIEIKSGETFKPAMVNALELFLEDGDQGYLLYRGRRFPYDEKIRIINYQDYFL
jgi:uncharacterized protein